MPLNARRALLVFTLAALPFLTGSSCTLIWSSGDDSSDKDDEDRDEERLVVVAGGHFGDPPVAGLRYVSGEVSGTTGDNGEYEYETGKSVQFFLGDIVLGPPVTAQPALTTDDLGAGPAGESPAGINIRRLLQSLDADPQDAAVTIPGEVQAAAVTTNPDVAAAIEFLDFADDEVFLNSASQLVAVLTANYPFTAVLVDATQLPARSVAR